MGNWKKYRPEKFEYRGRWIKNWFSNYDKCPFLSEGIVYHSVESYYQAHKTLDRELHKDIAMHTSDKAKQLGRMVNVREDWEKVKYEVMKNGLRCKFSFPEWRKRLLATGNEVLIEWNNWNDKIWGVSIKDNEGQNLLGKALMEVREEIK